MTREGWKEGTSSVEGGVVLVGLKFSVHRPCLLLKLLNSNVGMLVHTSYSVHGDGTQRDRKSVV